MKLEKNKSKNKKEYQVLLTHTIQSIQFELLSIYQINQKVKIPYTFYSGPSILEGKIVGASLNKSSKRISSYWVELKGNTMNTVAIPGVERGLKNPVYIEPSFWSPYIERYKKTLSGNTLVRIKTKALDKLIK